MQKEFLNERIASALLQHKAKAIRQLNMMYLNYLWQNKLSEAQALEAIKRNVQQLSRLNKGKTWR